MDFCNIYIPHDIIFELFKLLSPIDLHTLSSVNRLLNIKFNDEKLWSFLLENTFNEMTVGELFMENSKRTYKKCHLINNLIKTNFVNTIRCETNKATYNVCGHEIINIYAACKITKYESDPIKILPKGLFELDNIYTLFLTRNLLTSIPSEISNLKLLEELYLSRNELTTIPEEVYGLTKLRILILPYNKITEISPSIKNLTNLVALNIHSNPLKIIPQEISHLKKLRVLYLSKDMINEVHTDIWKLSTLQIFKQQNGKMMVSNPEIATMIESKYKNIHQNETNHHLFSHFNNIDFILMDFEKFVPPLAQFTRIIFFVKKMKTQLIENN